MAVLNWQSFLNHEIAGFEELDLDRGGFSLCHVVAYFFFTWDLLLEKFLLLYIN
jgi:hypothetical protein